MGAPTNRGDVPPPQQVARSSIDIQLDMIFGYLNLRHVERELYNTRAHGKIANQRYAYEVCGTRPQQSAGSSRVPIGSHGESDHLLLGFTGQAAYLSRSGPFLANAYGESSGGQGRAGARGASEPLTAASTRRTMTGCGTRVAVRRRVSVIFHPVDHEIP